MTELTLTGWDIEFLDNKLSGGTRGGESVTWAAVSQVVEQVKSEPVAVSKSEGKRELLLIKGRMKWHYPRIHPHFHLHGLSFPWLTRC